MSDAEVKFWPDMDEEDYLKGAVPGAEENFSFRCPKQANYRCGYLLIAGRTKHKRDGNNQNGGVAQWDWDGNREAPTFTPSINCKGCWHGYIRAGRCVDTAGKDEP